MAGKEWLDSFSRRNAILSMRKPENTSAARSYGFNKTAVNDFFENLEKILVKHELAAEILMSHGYPQC
ncbi:Jerky protein [Operophtera brumata]|uniref:Jerky protein n=1 Tax=Operophtera brumata TaxID=104452 RepID=A0A0L7KKR0_OPEBR|nr:Jerky protein [Operophtera brumata]